MDQMKPMKPMSPMEPMRLERWWPEDLGEPSASGSQNGLRYAAFPDRRRLLIERDGTLATYDCGDHRIGGVSQGDGASRSLTFTSQTGPVALDTLQRLD